MELARNLFHSGRYFRRPTENAAQLLRLGDPLLQLPAPIIPFFRLDRRASPAVEHSGD